ncbi:iron complex transport system substrate-binding protein [Tissierella praeacuta DSM 18095]|uniref:Iron complex transport system substrate-binding protein n=1 Tax=Tissierella praeacuta DSM 18095 TaxID=1123404 RepID=A0A1M4YGA1_9FIRM|nr:ABC transporter substrate-binding protein [Tissierella praeacuta]SHF04761.1 iron complex transport system substrate-binding protein [Tissierella praeacuta DSM 18095]SUP02048.1 corrinoid ABC transporter substrate-binding protein [Tissierella praeacuta]
MKKNILNTMILVLLIITIGTGCFRKTTNDNSSKDIVIEQSEEINDKNKDIIVNKETKYPIAMDIYGLNGEKYTQIFFEAPSKVVTNNPSSTELLLELGLGDRIIGIMKPDNAPREKWKHIYKNFNVLGDKMTMSKEIIVGSEPDLVFGRVMPFNDNSMGTIKDFNEMGINVYTQYASNFKIEQSLENVILDVRNIGIIFNVSEKANEYADSLQTRLNTIKDSMAQHSQKQPTKVLFMVTYIDGTFNTFGANSSFQREMLKTINAENVLETGTSSLTNENLVALNPDVIVYINSDRNLKTDSIAVESLLNDETIQSVTAIKNKKIIEIGYDEIMDYGARNFDTLEKLYDFIYKK